VEVPSFRSRNQNRTSNLWNLPRPSCGACLARSSYPSRTKLGESPPRPNRPPISGRRMAALRRDIASCPFCSQSRILGYLAPGNLLITGPNADLSFLIRRQSARVMRRCRHCAASRCDRPVRTGAGSCLPASSALPTHSKPSGLSSRQSEPPVRGPLGANEAQSGKSQGTANASLNCWFS
jgi:hypothetical protein